MTEQPATTSNVNPINNHAEEFIAYCEAEFERRANSDHAFDEPHYRTAMQLVVAKLADLAE